MMLHLKYESSISAHWNRHLNVLVSENLQIIVEEKLGSYIEIQQQFWKAVGVKHWISTFTDAKQCTP